MKKILALALALLLCMSCLAVSTVAYGYATDPVTVDLLIAPANIINATITNGVAKFDGTAAGLIKLPVPAIADEEIIIHIEGYMPNTVHRAYLSASNGNDAGATRYNDSGHTPDPMPTLNATYSIDMALKANSAGGATHVCIKAPWSSGDGNCAPAGMTITKLSVTYAAENIDDARLEELNAVIASQTPTNFSFTYGGKNYHGDIVTKYTGDSAQVGDNATINSYPATIESGFEIVAAASARYRELKGENAYIKVTVSAGTISQMEVVEGGGEAIGTASPAFVISNNGTTDYYFEGAKLSDPNVGETNKQIRVYGENAVVEAVAAVTLTGPETWEFTIAAPKAGDKLSEIYLMTTENTEESSLEWYEGDTLLDDKAVAEGGKTYTAIWGVYVDGDPGDLIVIINGNEADVDTVAVPDGTSTFVYYEEDFTVEEESSGVVVKYIVVEPEQAKPVAGGEQYGLKIVSVNGDTDVDKYIDYYDVSWHAYDCYTRDGDDWSWDLDEGDTFEEGYGYSQYVSISLNEGYEFADVRYNEYGNPIYDLYIVSKYDGVVRDATIYSSYDDYANADIFYNELLLDEWDITSIEFVADGPIEAGKPMPTFSISKINGVEINPDEVKNDNGWYEYIFDGEDNTINISTEWAESEVFFESLYMYEYEADWYYGEDENLKDGYSYMAYVNVYPWNYDESSSNDPRIPSISPECEVTLKVPTGETETGSFGDYFDHWWDWEYIDIEEFEYYNQDAIFVFFFNFGAEDMTGTGGSIVETDEGRVTGWFMTGDKYHAMIIGHRIITMEHTFDSFGNCIFCRHHVDVEEIEVEPSYESETEETEEDTVVVEDTNPTTGIALALVPAVIALAVVAFKKR